MTDLIPSRTPAEPSIRTGDPRKWWVLFSVAFGAFMAPLDTSIVNTVLPLIVGIALAGAFTSLVRGKPPGGGNFK